MNKLFLKLFLLISLALPALAPAADCPTFAAGDLDYITKLNALSAGCVPNVSLIYTVPRAAATGTVDAITATYSPAVTLTDKVLVGLVSAGANTSTTPTFAPNGLTAHTIVARGGAALVAGDIGAAGFVALLEYNSSGARWELMNPAKSRIASDVSGLGTGVATLLGAAVTGTGAPVGGTAPTISGLAATGTAGSLVRVAGFLTPGMSNGQKAYISLGDSNGANSAFYIVYNHNSTAASRYLSIQPFEGNPGDQLVLAASNNVGVGTTAPTETLTIKGGLSTMQTTAPTVACQGGGSPTVLAKSTAVAGQVSSAGATPGTDCTVTFNKAWVTAPICFIQNITTGAMMIPLSTTTTLKATGTINASDKLQWHCIGIDTAA